ncbi:protein-export protein SecB [Oceanicola granulosus HTCC2516]|uniref:Protein-export protein SecB n=1 Tax=Oceanicola granulosus (strain ATCC BAA-861 / DSM 15982 / KCTC 12143 / HTCC2516) TaxID=314256 RepID=Q2CJU9_OCEGH|nr:protein-export chaperone SecB [Oceanicola granulosus]EAR53040.1 protein-export protein SecB [Oceanicola granulosus HTCC2516]
MSDETTNGAADQAPTDQTNDQANGEQANAAQQQQQPQISQRVLGQFVRDLSFENIMVQKGVTGEVQPEIQVQVNLDAKKRQAENQYEVITKLKVTSKTKEKGDPLFLLELEYAGIFQVEGVPEQQLHPYLLIECPRVTFPFVRRIVSDVTRDGGFPPLNLEMIDFMKLYRQEVARRVQAQQQAAPQN